jgi:Zn-dependent protease
MTDPSTLDRPAGGESHRVSLIFLLIVGVFGLTAYALATGRGGTVGVFVFALTGWVISLCLHEFGHAAVAYAGGDRSVAGKGYLTLDPLRYANPVLSIALPLAFLAMGGLGFPGGAVYLNPGAIRTPLLRAATSAAGPAMNLLCLVAIALALQLSPTDSLTAALSFLALLQATALVLNLLPIPGLDGFGVIEPFLPPQARAAAARLGGLIGLVFLGAIFLLPQLFEPIWIAAFALSGALGVDPDAMSTGYRLFRFWEQPA